MVDFADIKEKARRFFLGRTGVYTISAGVKKLNVNSVKRTVSTSPVRTEVSVLDSHIVNWSREPAKGQRLDLFISSPQVRGGILPFFEMIKPGKLPLLSRQVQVHEAKEDMLKIPQTRSNRAATLPDKFKKKGIIAFFYPLIQDCVVKSVLEKESGTLHVWYNQNCRKKRGQVLCLVSDVGKSPPLSWRWF